MKSILIASAILMSSGASAGTVVAFGSAGTVDDISLIGLGTYYIPYDSRIGVGLTVDNGLTTDGYYRDNQPSEPLTQAHYEVNILRIGVAIPFQVTSNVIIAANMGVSLLDVEDTYSESLNGAITDSYDNSYASTVFSPGIDAIYTYENIAVGARVSSLETDKGTSLATQLSIGLKF